MKISLAQTRPVTGDVPANITEHLKIIARAVAEGAGLIVFSELSLTGYEPTLAKELAADSHDARFDCFQSASDASGIVIAAGMPTRHDDGVRISLLLFQPSRPRSLYSKTYLHADEEPFFVPGRSSPEWQVGGTKIALAICYEISVDSHLQSALQSQPDVYIASVAKSPSGIGKALDRLAGIARTHSIPVLMPNAVGMADGGKCAGKSSAWNVCGELIGQLTSDDEGLLTMDVVAGTVASAASR